jgi:hypothetical protein
MKKDGKENAGIQLLLKKYRSAFRIPENTEYYSKPDYETAEKKFLQYALMVRKVDIQREVQEAQQHS